MVRENGKLMLNDRIIISDDWWGDHDDTELIWNGIIGVGPT